MDELIIDEGNIEEKFTGQFDEQGQIRVPVELADAPVEVIELYKKWVEIDKVLKSAPERYYSFVNSLTGEVEHIDCIGIKMNVIRTARKKHIPEQEIRAVEDACSRMANLKHQKGRAKMRWLNWIRPRMGRDVFEWRKAEIIEMFGRYSTADEVKRKLVELGYQVAIDHVYKFLLNNKDVIDKKRVEFIRSVKDHYLATDAGRMETLAILHSRFMKMFDEAYNQGKRDTSELKAISGEIRALLEQARKEIKGEEIKLTVDGKIDINASIQAAITIQELSRKLPINIIPVYLVAVKQRINPSTILTQLVGSFYKDFNGFNRLQSQGSPQSTIDLIRNYDWNEIVRHHTNKSLQQPETIDFEELPVEQSAAVKSKRQKLMELIDRQSKDPSVKDV